MWLWMCSELKWAALPSSLTSLSHHGSEKLQWFQKALYLFSHDTIGLALWFQQICVYAIWWGGMGIEWWFLCPLKAFKSWKPTGYRLKGFLFSYILVTRSVSRCITLATASLTEIRMSTYSQVAGHSFHACYLSGNETEHNNLCFLCQRFQLM